MTEPLQLALNVARQSLPTLDEFVIGDNALLWHSLPAHQQGLYYLWGAPASGKSHLLQALTAQQPAGTACYLALDLPGMHPGVLDNLEQYHWLVWDGLDALAGQAEWEEALFHSYNRLQQQGAALVVSARKPPLELGIVLPDLRSRLTSGICIELKTLDEAGLLQVLQLQARRRGLELSEDVGQFLLRRFPRDLSQLMPLLTRLDQASLSHQRRLTIPFVKQVLAL